MPSPSQLRSAGVQVAAPAKPRKIVHRGAKAGVGGAAGGGKVALGPAAPKKPRTKTERRSYLDNVIDNVHSGVYDEATGAKLLKAAGFPDSKNPFVSEDISVGDIAHAVAAPIGLSRSTNIRTSRAVHDAFVATHGRAPHVGEVPELNLGGTVAVGPGLVAGLGRQLVYSYGQGIVNTPGGGVAFALHPVGTAKRIGEHLFHPNVVEDALLGYLALHAGASGVLRARGAAQAISSGAGTRAAVTRSAREGGSLLHTPRAKPYPIRIPGAGPEPLPMESVPAAGHTRLYQSPVHPQIFTDTRNAAQTHYVDVTAGELARPSLVEVAPGVYRVPRTITAVGGGRVRPIEGPPRVPASQLGPVQGPPREGITIERPVVQNPLVRPFSRARSKRIERKVTSLEPEKPAGKIRTKLRGTFSAQTTVGRENRARIRIEQEIANASAHELGRLTSPDLIEIQNNWLPRLTDRLTPAERDALTVVAISGDEALTNPAAAIARQTAAHQHFIEIGGDPSRNIEHIRAVQNARRVLENPSERFLNVVALAREVATEQTEQRLIQSGHLEGAAAVGRQQKMAEIYGYSAPPPGSFFIPLSERYQNTGILPAGPFQRSPSMYGMGPPSAPARVPGLNKEFTGAQVAAGRLPDVGGATARRAIQVNNLLSVEKQYDDLFRIGRLEKRSEFDIPIRASSDVRKQLRQYFSDLTKRAESNRNVPADEIVTSRDIQDLRDLLDASVQYGDREIGAASRIPGIRWVDSRFIAEMGPSARARLYNAADAITNPIRVTQLYARPAYILNLAGNLGMNGISEGVRVFPAAKKAATWQKDLPADVQRMIDGGVGVSLSRTYSIGRGVGGRLSDRMAEFWNRLTDMHSRRIAFYAEAAREGFKTREQIVDLMTNPQHAATRIRIFRQANKNIVDYSSLTPFERDEIRRIVYFYPWVSRGTIWSLRAMVEHPYKTFTLFELGQIGAENAHRALGQHQPSWVEELGLIPLGAKGDRTKVINPSSVWTPTTAVQAFSAGVDTAKAVIGLPHGRSGLGDFLTPGAELFAQASARQGFEPSGSGLLGQIQSLSQVQALRRAGVWGEPSKTYPERGVGPAVGPLGAGGFYPRAIRRGAIGEQAVGEATTPKAKLMIQIDQLVEAGLTTQDRADKAKAALEKASDKDITSARRTISPLLAIASDIGELEARGKITPERAQAMRAGLFTATPTQIREARAALKQALGG